jgi:hypothetical protein
MNSVRQDVPVFFARLEIPKKIFIVAKNVIKTKVAEKI